MTNQLVGLKKRCETQKIVDTWRWFYPEILGYTWRRLNPRLKCSRLDYVFVDEELVQSVDSITLGCGYRSDHSLLSTILVFDEHERGPGYWKLNTSLLRIHDYVEKMNKLLDIELSQTFSSFKSKWELTKLAIRGSTIQYTVRRQKVKHNQSEVLDRKLSKLQQELDNNEALFRDTKEQIRLVQHEIREITAEKTKGAIIRSRANYALKGEMPTKYFLQLEKKRAQSKTLLRLQNQKGEIITEQKQVLGHIKIFIKNFTPRTLNQTMNTRQT